MLIFAIIVLLAFVEFPRQITLEGAAMNSTASKGVETGLMNVNVSCNAWYDPAQPVIGDPEHFTVRGTVEIGLVQIPVTFLWSYLRRNMSRERERTTASLVVGENGTLVLTHLTVDGYLTEVMPTS